MGGQTCALPISSKALARESSPAKSFQSNSHGTRARWPDDEIGMNSVRPWTIPRTMAWRRGMGEIVLAYENPRRCGDVQARTGGTVLAPREGHAGADRQRGE